MMKFLIFVTFLVGVLYAAKSKKSKGGTKQLLQAIKDELSELKKGQGVLGEKIQSLDDGQGVLGEKIQSLDDRQGVLGEKIDDGQGVLGEKIQSLDDRQGVLGEKIDDGQGVLEEKIQSLDDGQGVLGKKIQSLDDGQGVLGEKIQSLDDRQGVLGEKIQSFDDGQGVLGEKIQSLDVRQGVLAEKIQSCEKKLGTWRLGMNINPADGHIFGYTVGWATSIDIGSDDEALTKDYLSAKVWATPANYIAIVRHQRGVVDAVKVFKFKVPGESLSTRFGLKNMNPGRQIVTQGGPIQESIADDADNLGDDPSPPPWGGKINYQTLTDFCNDNLDCIDYEAWNNGAIAIFHGVPDAKTAHIFQMNQATRSKNAPNARPIPMRFQAKFGNFFKPKHKVLEMQNKLNNEPLELPDKHKRRIVTVIKSCPEGLSTDEVKLKYSELYEEPFPMQHLCDITKKRYLVDILALIQQLRHLNGRWMVLNETPPDNRPAPPAPPIVPKDISKSAEFPDSKDKRYNLP
ncbi:uncharacterized protein LOC134818630 [Bolinopsis microptera]|uniref:uncharacterized protein LOC134818630 n=1 Tax=Bolinopsis microptera TaxID=2820187 RepID=UPI003079EEAB